MVPKGLLTALVAGAALLPIAITLIAGTSFLFAALQDAAVAKALNGLALGLGLLWAFNLVALVLALSFDAVARADDRADPPAEEE